MISDVPIGAFLSGGIDSSTIVAFASKFKPKINTFSVKFDYADFDESRYAEQVSKLFNTEHQVLTFNSKDVRDFIDIAPEIYDEPLGDSSMIPTYLVSKLARNKVTVSLSGDGGDELFARYESYKHLAILQLAKFYPGICNTVLEKLASNLGLHRYIKSYAQIANAPKDFQYARIMTFLYPKDIEELTGSRSEIFYKNYQKYCERSWLNTALHTDLRGYLPDEILMRKKMGFGVPLKYYFENDLNDYVQLIDQTDVTKYGLKNVDLRRYNNCHVLYWRYLMYIKWFERWMLDPKEK